MFAVKAGDDLRQEQLASQFFALAHRILKQSPLRARAGLRYVTGLGCYVPWVRAGLRSGYLPASPPRDS